MDQKRQNQTEKEIRFYFLLGVAIKALISLGEVAAGILLFIAPTLVDSFAQGSGILLAFFLLTRGLIKLGLIGALLKNQLWAYPVSLVVMAGFIVYQIWDIAVTHSIVITGITIFDFIFVTLIYLEYRVMRRHLGKAI